MTVIIGLAGQARCGKNTIANYLAARYGFVQFAFSDALYREVQEAYGLADQSLLRDDATKDGPQEELALRNLVVPSGTVYQEHPFASLVFGIFQNDANNLGLQIGDIIGYHPLPPRQVLQWWGTEYRRAQDPDYWIKRAQEFVDDMRYRPTYPEHAPQFFVETGTRFENEREWITDTMEGNVWHIHRDIDAPGQGHVSAVPLPVLSSDRELWNNGTVEQLHYGIDLMLSQSIQQVRIEPMLPMESYAPQE